MPVHLTFTLEKVFLRAGTCDHTFSSAGQVRPTRPWDRLTQFGTMIFWPKAVGWLKLTATATPEPATAGPPVAFSPTVAGLDAVCAAHNVKRDQLAPQKFLETNSLLVASLPQHNRVFLQVVIDTDDDVFRRTVKDKRNAEKEELVQTVQLLFFDAKQFGNYIDQPGKIDFVLKPCSPVPRYPGVLAIDLGNTTTTAASLSESDPVYKTDSVRYIPLEPASPHRTQPEAMLSVVRIDQINTLGPVPEGTRRYPSIPADDRPTSINYVAGEWVTAGSAGGELPSGVVYGAKQLLTTKDPTVFIGAAPAESHFTLTLPHLRPNSPVQSESVEVLDRLPGELLFAHAIRQFRQGASGWPPDLALTYPTTYSPRELRQLARAGARGWLRAMGQAQGFESDIEPNEDPQLEQLAIAVRSWLGSTDAGTSPADCPLIGLTLDEATAAAFFHTYRRVFEQPGGLLRFRYLYPEGLRLLIFDCGGGTTDIALVHAISPPNNPKLLELDVLARTGVRAFGGDHITRELCRILKAKLGLLLAKVRTPTAVPSGLNPLPLSGPPAAEAARAAVEDFIAKVSKLDPNDDLVPTKFNPLKPDPNTPARRTAAHGLWKLAEKIKRKLGDGKAVKLKDLGPEATGRESSPLMAAVLRPLPLATQNQLLNQIADLVVSPWEVDALIRKRVEGAVTKCNRLIRKHLVDNARDGREYEIDWVVVSGNGARYPLVTKVVRDQLHVAYIDDRLTFDPENLKDAVAKGAAMARMVERVPRAVGIKFNRHLSELLPFDVGYHNMGTNATEPLFAEYTPYKELASQTRLVKLVVPDGVSTTLGNTFILERRFPGDDGYTPFVSYQFTQGIQGELEVKYDPLAGEFEVRDTASGEIGIHADLTEADHQVAVLRGDI
ncbi:MAG: hypothetical protein K2P78_12250 [Gemmataceae bacterium]|nr:hypothetical protein [Gemmataceae bacterium]